MSLEDRLGALSRPYPPIHRLGERLLRYGAQSAPGHLRIGHRPWVGPENYALILFPPSSPEGLADFETRHRRPLPGHLREFLGTTNGVIAYGISLYGLTPSTQGNPPLMDRSAIQCHDLGIANTDWFLEYPPQAGTCHFGSRTFGWADKLGYFMDGSGKIRSISEKHRAVRNEWGSFPEFLSHELAAAEQEEKEDPKSWWKD